MTASDRKQGHTPGPWTVESDGTSITMAGQVVIVAPAPDWAPIEVQRANARRIVACWNSCDGIATDALELNAAACNSSVAGMVAAIEERDALRAALVRFIEWNDRDLSTKALETALDAARAALGSKR